MKRFVAHFAVIASVFVFYANVFAGPTMVQGNVSGIWDVSGSPYLAIDNCTVQNGQVLTIEPGVTVILSADVSINVYGQIIAVGNQSHHILFEGTNENYPWEQLYIYGNGSVPPTSEFKYCDFRDAKKALYVYIQGHVDNAWTTMQVNIFNCTFANSVDTAIYGEAYGRNIYQFRTPRRRHAKLNPIIEQCIFEGTNRGIELYIHGSCNAWCGAAASNPIIRNCIFYDLAGPAFNMLQASRCSGAPEFTNNTVVDCNKGALLNDPFDATIKNNIFFENSTAVERTGSLSGAVFFNCFFNNDIDFEGYPSGYGTVVMENNNGEPCDIGFNIFIDPLFVDAENANYQLTTSSPCIDAGDSNSPYFDTCFPPSLGTEINDMGAYGGPGACQWENCNGDFDSDLDIDGSDLSVFAADFGRTDCSGDCEGDFDENGNIDRSDLAVFAADFGRTDCPFHE